MNGSAQNSQQEPKGARDTAALFESGKLLHPLSPHHPGYLDLIRYLYRISGADDLPAPRDGEQRIAGFVGVPEHIVFVLVDGMGLNTSVHFPRGGFLDRGFACEMRALFPSTTAAVLTSTANGFWPAENGITGWWTCVPEYGYVLLPLPFVERESGMPVSRLGITFDDLVRHPPLLDVFEREVCSFVPDQFADGSFTAWMRGAQPLAPFGSLDELARKVKEFLASPGGLPTFTYIYISEVDTLSHEHGYDAPEVGETVRRIDRFLARLAGELPNEARLVVTADHGQVIVDGLRHTIIDRESELMRYLEYPPSGEPAVPVFHVKPGHESGFADAFAASEAGSSFDLLETDRAEELELFGPRPLSDAMRRRLGTYIGIATEAALLDYVAAGDRPPAMLGAHGGLRAEEMRIGLFVSP